MAPYSLLHSLSSVCFEEKIQFSASQHLSLARSKWFTLPETEIHSDVWSIKPPDFSLKLYRSLSVPQRKERKTHSNLIVHQFNETKRRPGIFLPNVLHESHQREESPKFITSYRPPDALESELMFVKTGKYLSGPYKNPKPHDFRPLNEDLPDIVTTYERDPGNLNLKLKHLDIIRTTRSKSDSSSRDTKPRMDTYKPAEPRWDAKLILPQLPWPPKSASYTEDVSPLIQEASSVGTGTGPDQSQPGQMRARTDEASWMRETPTKKRSIQRILGTRGGETLKIVAK